MSTMAAARSATLVSTVAPSTWSGCAAVLQLPQRHPGANPSAAGPGRVPAGPTWPRRTVSCPRDRRSWRRGRWIRRGGVERRRTSPEGRNHRRKGGSAAQRRAHRGVVGLARDQPGSSATSTARTAPAGTPAAMAVSCCRGGGGSRRRRQLRRQRVSPSSVHNTVTPRSARAACEAVQVDAQSEQFHEPATAADDLVQAVEAAPGDVAGAQLLDRGAEARILGLLRVSEHHIGAAVDQFPRCRRPRGTGGMNRLPPGIARPMVSGCDRANSGGR